MIKGLAQGLGITKTVTSPTFNIQRNYDIPGGGVLEHFDFYRIENDPIIARQLGEILTDDTAIVAVEWANNLKRILKDDRLTVTIHFKDETMREIEIEATGPNSQRVLEGLKHDLSA